MFEKKFWGKKLKKKFEKKNLETKILEKKLWGKKLKKKICKKNLETNILGKKIWTKILGKKIWRKNFEQKVLRKKFWKQISGKPFGKILENHFEKKFWQIKFRKINYKTEIFITKIYSNIDKCHTICVIKNMIYSKRSKLGFSHVW